MVDILFCLFMKNYTVVEITGSRSSVTGIHSHSACSVGYALNSLFSYYLRDWRVFYFAISVTPLPYLIFHFFIPESPRWCFSKGYDEQGKIIAEKFAKINGKKITKEDWEISTTENKVIDRKYNSLDLFKSTNMKWIIFKMMFCWFATALIYYGFSLNAGNLSGNIFVNNALNGCVEIVAYIFVQFTINRLGRRVLLSSMFFLQTVSCVLSIVLSELSNGNETMLNTSKAFAFIGKAAVSACFGIVYNYTAELFPTVVRANAVGLCSLTSRVGSISAPYLIYIQDFVSWLPFTIFSFVALIAGFLSLMLPETTGYNIMRTMQEAEDFYIESKKVIKKPWIKAEECKTYDNSVYFDKTTTKF